MKFALLSALLLAVALVGISGAAVVGSASIKAPAVIIYNNTGSLTGISLTITTGNGTVNFAKSTEVANDTRYSAYVAARYASIFTGRNFSKYNFTYSINDSGANVSGPSAGAAMSLLAISAFENRPLRRDFTMTGTIGPSGEIGEIGGAIDKASAAASFGLKLILVPWAPPGSLEEGTYYIAQIEYKIPVVEVVNISQAAAFAFGNSSGVANEVSLNFSGYSGILGLPISQLNCTNGCNEAPFHALANYTVGAAEARGLNLSSSGFGKAASQLSIPISQAAEINGKGYLYVSADIAFLNALDEFYLSSFNMSRTGALSSMQGIQSECSNLTAPQLTLSNYEYVIAAEVRQGWANYTINSTLANFNSTGATADDIVSAMYSAGEAQSWCSATVFLYGYPYNNSQAPVTFSQSLKQLAFQKLNRAGDDQGMYLTLAREAYAEGNYPVAIIDADYAYVLGQAPSAALPSNTSALDQAAIAIAHNSTYGAWATEFSKEALFYAYESSISNSTLAQSYAGQAYSSALLSSQIGNDTSAIYSSFVAAAPQIGNLPNDSISTAMLENLSHQVKQLTIITAVVLALLAGCLVLVAVLAHKVLVLSTRSKGRARRKR